MWIVRNVGFGWLRIDSAVGLQGRVESVGNVLHLVLAGAPRDAEDIKSRYLLYAIRPNVCVGGTCESGDFALVYGLERVGVHVGASLYFRKHHSIVLYGYDIDFVVARAPVGLHYRESVCAKFFACELFAPFSNIVVTCHLIFIMWVIEHKNSKKLAMQQIVGVAVKKVQFFSCCKCLIINNVFKNYVFQHKKVAKIFGGFGKSA